MGRILVVDDEPAVRSALGGFLSRAGHEVEECLDGLSAVERLRGNQIDLALLDLRLPQISGLEVLRRAKRHSPGVKVILMSAYLDLEATQEAVKCGADKVVPKPCDMDRLGQAIQRLLGEDQSGPHIVAESPEMIRVLDRVDRLAKTSVGLLLIGETGSGKELLARRIHENSPRRDGPCVKVDCAALPESLLETELFGHEANVFTDGTEARTGRIPAADGGTLFLDEVANLTLTAQAKLLRALAEGEVQRLGAARPIPVDIRVVAATNVALLDRVKHGDFREDLYYRLAEAIVGVPPLRDRPLDIVPLALCFLREVADEHGLQIARFRPAALAVVKAARWPGNVRELRSVVREAAVLSKCDEITLRSILDAMQGEGRQDGHDNGQAGSGAWREKGLKETVAEVVTDLEHVLIAEALEATGWNRLRAAELLRIDYKTLLTKIKKSNIACPDGSGKGTVGHADTNDSRVSESAVKGVLTVT